MAVAKALHRLCASSPGSAWAFLGLLGLERNTVSDGHYEAPCSPQIFRSSLVAFPVRSWLMDPEYIFSPAEFEERLHKLFRPENGERPEEATLRRAFRTQYNAFEYDFGLLFDEDFAVCDYCMEPTEDPQSGIPLCRDSGYSFPEGKKCGTLRRL